VQDLNSFQFEKQAAGDHDVGDELADQNTFVANFDALLFLAFQPCTA